MTPVKAVAALGALCGLGANFGWGHTLTGVGVLAILMITLHVAARARVLYEGSAAELDRPPGDAVATALLALAAAASGTRGGLDLFREGVGILDEMRADGATPQAVLLAAIEMAIRMPGQAPTRARSKAAPPRPTAPASPDDVPPEPTDEKTDEAAASELREAARTFSSSPHEVVDDKLSFSATLMRAGEVSAANKLLEEAAADVRDNEAHLREAIEKVKQARAARRRRPWFGGFSSR